MKLRSLTPLLTAGAIALGTSLFPEQPAHAQSTTFFCGASQGVPVTYANTPRGNVPIIRWRSNYFSDSGYTPERRCDEVSGRFQTYYNSGSLNFITTGMMNGQPVVCVSATNGGGCQGLLLTLRPNDNASQVVQQLFDIRAGAAGPINQSANRVYIDVNQLLETGEVEAGSTPAAPTESTAPSAQPETQPSTQPGGSVW
jgi:Circadian oscillating protein COP23